MELSPPLAQPPLSHHNHHCHPPLSPPPLSQPPRKSRTKLHFHIVHFQILREVSHENFAFTSSTFSSNNSFGKHLSPAVSCACLLLILDEQHVPRKAVFQQAMGQRLADIVSFSFGLSFGTAGWIKKTAKQWFWETLLLKILNAVLNKAWGFPKGIKERAESRAPTLFLPQGKTLFLSPAWRVVTSKSWGKKLICGRAVLEIYSACSANSSIDRPSPHSNAHHQVAPVVKGFCRLPISQTDGECYWMPT